MKKIICTLCFSVLTLAVPTNAQVRDWEKLVELPVEAQAVLDFQEWELPIGSSKKILARVVQVHAGKVTFQIKGSASKEVDFDDLEPEYQKLVLDWRKWKPRNVYFNAVKVIKDNNDKPFKSQLVATVGTSHAIFRQAGTSSRGNGYHCVPLHKIEPYDRLSIYLKRFHGEFAPMDVTGEDTDKIKNLGFKGYRWIPGRGDSKVELMTQLYTPQLKRDSDKVPLVVFLHGKGEAGADNTKQFKHPQILTLINESNKRRFPCFLLCPQHPKCDTWFGVGPGIPSYSMKAVTDMVNMLIHDNPQIDPARIYITGLSSGGLGSLEFITCWPETYAAAVAMSASLKAEYFNEKNARPFWAIWNKEDLPGAEKVLKDVGKLYKKWNVDMKTTIYEKGGHDAWSEGYTEEGFMKWLFSQSLAKRR